MGTFVEIELDGQASPEKLNTWITAGFEAVADIDRLMSIYRPDSDLSRLNQARPGVWVDVHPHTLKVLKASHELYRVSDGNFDIRCGRVAGGRMRVPLLLRSTRACKTGRWTFDLGGIAKGYAVDCAVETIKKISKGHRLSGIVNAGGDLRRWGGPHAPVAVATSTVRTPETCERLSPAVHVRMPEGKIYTKQKTVSVFSARCLWSDALTKIKLLAPPLLADHCLKKYNAHGMVLA